MDFQVIKTTTKKLKQYLVSNVNHQCQLCHCDTPLSQQWVCTTCERELPFSPAACITCAAPLKSSSDRQCGQCLINPPSLDRLITCFDYLYPINKWLPAFKFSRQTALAPWLANHLANSIINRSYTNIDQNNRSGFENQNLRANALTKKNSEENGLTFNNLKKNNLAKSNLKNSNLKKSYLENHLPLMPEAIIAVPLHGKRLKQRGYNQSELIAKQLSRLLGIPLLTDAVIRTKKTEAQSGLSLKQRQSNILQAFQVSQNLPAHIALVDDVFTTGSTLNELSRQLKLAGCEFTQGWVIAHAPLA